MIPVKYLEELKTAPVEEVDFVATFIEVSLFHERVLKIPSADRGRCSKANILQWAADRRCIPGSSRPS